jgi:hypothetical protein
LTFSGKEKIARATARTVEREEDLSATEPVAD